MKNVSVQFVEKFVHGRKFYVGTFVQTVWIIHSLLLENLTRRISKSGDFWSMGILKY